MDGVSVSEQLLALRVALEGVPQPPAETQLLRDEQALASTDARAGADDDAIQGAKVLVVGRTGLPFAETGNPLLDPVSMIQTSYGFIEQTALALGRNPDQPRLLKKITETV